MNAAPVYAALYARLKSNMSGVATFTRRAFTLDALPAMPCVEVYPTHQTPVQEPGRPTKWLLGAAVAVYVPANTDPDLDASPDDTLLGFVTQVEAALAYQPGETPSAFTSLGGACERAQIAGTIGWDQGTVAGIAAVVIPVEMVVAR